MKFEGSLVRYVAAAAAFVIVSINIPMHKFSESHTVEML